VGLIQRDEAKLLGFWVPLKRAGRFLHVWERSVQGLMRQADQHADGDLALLREETVRLSSFTGGTGEGVVLGSGNLLEGFFSTERERLVWGGLKKVQIPGMVKEKRVLWGIIA